MTDSFQDDSPRKTTLSTCSAHQLKYDPKLTWGCVLCRKNQSRRISGYGIVGGVLIVIALVFLYSQVSPITEPNAPPQIRTATAPSTANGVSPTDAESKSRCLKKISSEIEDCLAPLSPKESEQIDREFCLDRLADLDQTCPSAFSGEMALREPLYSIGDMPSWPGICAVIEQHQQRIEHCTGSNDYHFAMRLTVDASEGTVQDMILSSFGLETPSIRFCLYEAIRSLRFPVSDGGEFSVVIFVDSAILSQKRIEVPDYRKEEFERFLREQRQQERQEQHSESLQQQRDKRNRTIQEKFQAQP